MHGGREEEFIFFIRARSSLPVPLHTRIKALYLTSTILDVWNPYSWQKKEETPGMSTFCEVRDFNAMIKSSSSLQPLERPHLSFPKEAIWEVTTCQGMKAYLMLQ